MGQSASSYTTLFNPVITRRICVKGEGALNHELLSQHIKDCGWGEVLKTNIYYEKTKYGVNFTAVVDIDETTRTTDTLEVFLDKQNNTLRVYYYYDTWWWVSKYVSEDQIKEPMPIRTNTVYEKRERECMRDNMEGCAKRQGTPVEWTRVIGCCMNY